MVSCSARILIASCLVLAWVLGAPISAQTPSGQTQVPKVKAGRAVPIVSVEGRDNYVAYCAVCHGLDGTGNGPAAPAMKKPVAALSGPSGISLRRRFGGWSYGRSFFGFTVIGRVDPPGGSLGAE